MNFMKQSRQNICFALLAGLMILGAGDSTYSQTTAKSVVDRFISKQADEAEGEEYRNARRIVRGDLNRDSKPDLVVLYTLEGFNGGNNYAQYLAVFLGNGKVFRYSTSEVVGGKLFRNLIFKSFAGGRINFDTKEFRDTDGTCCPSKKGKTSYILSGKKLKEIN